MTKTNRKLVAKTAKTVLAKRTHLSMKAYAACENHVVKVDVNGTTHTVKSDNWYVAFPANDGPVGFEKIHCLIKAGVALFASEKNYMRPRMYKPLAEFLTPELTGFERR